MPVSIYSGYHLNVHQPQLRYYLETRGAGERRRPSNSTARPGFLQLSPEIRNRIYGYALVLDSSVGPPPIRRTDPRLRSPGWEQRSEITACFNFMLSCRTIYDEASPVFWGCNTFTAYVSTTERLTTVFDQVGRFRDWGVWVCVKSYRSRAMIRKLCWQVSDAWDDHQLQSSKQAPVLCNVWRVATPLSLVSEIVFEFNEKHSSMTNIPMPHEVAGYVDTPNVHTLHMLKRSRLVDDAAQFYCEAALALQALADFNYFPNVRDIWVNGVVMRPKMTIQWEGLDLNRFDKESPFMRRFSARVRAHGKHFIFDKPKRITTLCQRCGAQWDPDHWSEDNEDLICPGFADDELGGEIAIYSVDDWIEAEDDEPSEYGGPESYNDWEYEY